jgi:heme exporter protein A
MPPAQRSASDPAPAAALDDALDHALHDAPPLPDGLEARGVVRAFGGRRAVDGVSLQLRPGACLALFGPNGAGKTTLLKLLGGLLAPTRGMVWLRGHRLPGGPDARRLVGLLSHHALLYPALTVRENVRFAAECQGIVEADGAATTALRRLAVLDRADMPVRALSRGLQQRVSIARALVHQPRLVLLDEPYTGLDEVGGGALTGALRTLQGDGAILVLTTHHLHEGLALATEAAILREGRVVHRVPAGDPGFGVEAFQAAYRALMPALPPAA